MTPRETSEFNHLNEEGQAHMVDVSTREITTRSALASGKVLLSHEVVDLLREEGIPKGDVLAAARIAGIMGAKRTVDLIPLCHPIAISGISLDVHVVDDGVEIEARVKTSDRTGVEMEALTAVSIAALTVIDMVKALDPFASISHVRVEAKDGGRNGSWKRS
jgi:cyclic pyranopterin phosphate synthase